MGSYQIKSWTSLHEGGTKFYRVYAISASESKRAFVVTHWGAYHDGGTTPTLPLFMGQSKIKEVRADAVEWEADRAMSAKRGRGYRFDPPEVRNIHLSIEFAMLLRKSFKPAQVQTMKDALIGGADAPGITGAEPTAFFHDEVREEDAVDDGGVFEPESASKPSHSEWGSW